VGGVTIESESIAIDKGLQWSGPGYFGAPSKELLAFPDNLLVDFTTSVNAFGVDLREFQSFQSAAVITVYGTDDTTVLGTFNLVLLTGGTPLFWGFHDAGGIGSVLLDNTTRTWSPIIDNLEFGQAQSAPVPEPASLTLLGLGLAGMAGRRWRQRKA